MAANMFFKFTDPAIIGGSRDPNHVGEIEVLSWSQSFVQPARLSGGGGVVEQATHSNLSFTKYPDSASADLLKTCWNGKQIGKALLSCYRADGNGAPAPYLEIELLHVVITNLSISGGPGDMPVESISLDYGVVTYRYSPRTAGGANQVSHDLIRQIVS